MNYIITDLELIAAASHIYTMGDAIFTGDETANVYDGKRMIGTVQKVKGRWGWASTLMSTSKFDCTTKEGAFESIVVEYENRNCCQE